MEYTDDDSEDLLKNFSAWKYSFENERNVFEY